MTTTDELRELMDEVIALRKKIAELEADVSKYHDACLEAEGKHSDEKHRADKAEAEAEANADAALARIAELEHAIHEASDPDFLWGAMDNVNDMDADLEDFAEAASRAIRAALTTNTAQEEG